MSLLGNNKTLVFLIEETTTEKREVKVSNLECKAEVRR